MLFSDLAKDIKFGGVMRYMLMPQVVPRLGDFYNAGFGQLAYFIALVYRAVNILPADHPIMRRADKKHLGVREVLAAAAAELKFTRGNIDKIIIYFAVLIGLLMLGIQFFILLAYVMMHPAFAGNIPTTYAGFFATPNYAKDVAYGILYMVFGVPQLFNPSGPVRPFHTALYSLFQFYSIGLLVIAVIIACYMIFAIIVETAQTGVPFGKRYNHAWSPIRFVFALGLLIPVGFGLNSAQWISLYAAKFGSDFATQGWIIFNNKMQSAYLSNPLQRVGTPQAPQMTNLASFMSVAMACQHAYEAMYANSNQPMTIDAYLTKNSSVIAKPKTLTQIGTYTQAKQYFNDGDILIRFGQWDAKNNTKWLGNVVPLCGDLVISSGDASEAGAVSIQDFYFKTVLNMWGTGYNLRKLGEGLFDEYTTDQQILKVANPWVPPDNFKQQLFDPTVSGSLTSDVEKAIVTSVQAQASSNTWNQIQTQIAEYGWGGAGLWYNKIAQINGSLVTAVGNVPAPKAMPMVMEYVKAEQLQQNNKVGKTVYTVNLADGRAVQFNTLLDEPIARGLSDVFQYWYREDGRQDDMSNQTRQTNNIFIDSINAIFGTKGLFDMCRNADVHPLSQLSMLGKGLVEASIRNLALAVGANVAGAVMPLPFIGAAAGAAGHILMTVASITITMGFLLFYVIPFMPFLYFFFAVGGWVKGLFEAMVGVPLWALAHMRIDGEGLPGDAALTGYFLIFEIFLRPILIVFGMLASIVIFSAMVKVLNEVFYLVVVNLSGHDETSKTLCGYMGSTGSSSSGGGGGGSGSSGPGTSAIAFFRGPIDEFFFTVIYAIIVYMIGMSCFKLIDLIPNNLLRYMNFNTPTFNDQQNDPARGLMQRLSIGSQNISSSVLGAAGQGMNAVGNTVKGLTELAGKSGG